MANRYAALKNTDDNDMNRFGKVLENFSQTQYRINHGSMKCRKFQGPQNQSQIQGNNMTNVKKENGNIQRQN
jgi:hypothetical protein